MADIHIRLMERHEEYLYVFNRTYNFLRDEVKKGIIGIIVICGDIFHNKNQLTPECVDVCKGVSGGIGFNNGLYNYCGKSRCSFEQ